MVLVDWITSFLKSLEKFNGIMDQIATVSIMLCPATPSWVLMRCLDSSLRASSVDYPLFRLQGLANVLHWSQNLTEGLQIIIEQGHLDDSVCNLLLEDE